VVWNHGSIIFLSIQLGIWNVIIPTDELHHFSEGLKPPTRMFKASRGISNIFNISNISNIYVFANIKKFVCIAALPINDISQKNMGRHHLAM
jgi:hypothetical protein